MVDIVGLFGKGFEWVFTPKLINELLEAAGIDLELPSVWELAFAICQAIAAMLAPFFIYIMIGVLIVVIIWRFPDILKPTIEYLQKKLIHWIEGVKW